MPRELKVSMVSIEEFVLVQVFSGTADFFSAGD